MQNKELNNENLEYYIEIDGQKIPVTEAVYRAYKRPAWKEKKRQQRQREKGTGGPDCTKAVGAAPLSIDRMLEDGLDIPQGGSSLEDTVIMNELIGELHKALAQLAPNDRAILDLFGDGLSDRKISAETGIPQTTVSYRRKILIKKLREQLKDYR